LAGRVAVRHSDKPKGSTVAINKRWPRSGGPKRQWRSLAQTKKAKPNRQGRCWGESDHSPRHTLSVSQHGLTTLAVSHHYHPSLAGKQEAVDVKDHWIPR